MKRLHTVRDALRLIMDNMQSSNPAIRQHAATLAGPRTRGSTTELGLEDLEHEQLNTRLIKEIRYDQPCDYYCAFLSELGGRVAAVPFEDAFAMYPGEIKVRNGEHGLELYIDQDIHDAKEIDADDGELISFIVGIEDGEEVLFTWHPGHVLRPLSDGIGEDTAVKTHNG